MFGTFLLQKTVDNGQSINQVKKCRCIVPDPHLEFHQRLRVESKMAEGLFPFLNESG